MIPEEQRIALAEWAGYTLIERKGCKGWFEWVDSLNRVVTNAYFGREQAIAAFPYYTTDLNAVHELEMRLKWEPESEYCEAQEYYEQLVFVCGRNIPKAGKSLGYICHLCGEQIYDSQPTDHSENGLVHTECPQADCCDWHLVTATAAQRCEALCRVLFHERWKEGV